MAEYSIRQHRPAYVTGFENQVSKYSTLEELKEINWVKSFSELPNFYRYSVSQDAHPTLMAELNDGYEWWVIGFVDDNEIIKQLPEFKPKYKNEKSKK